MQNDSTLNGKQLGKITEDFVKISDVLKESSYQIRTRKYSDHPIFVISDQELDLGLPLIKKGERENKWNYNAALPEHFIEKEIIELEKYEEFVGIYKDPEEYCCLFVVLPNFNSFIFLPYPEDSFDSEIF